MSGAQFEQDILVALDRAHELVVIFTPWSLDRHVWAELGAAWGKRIPIVVLSFGRSARPAEIRDDEVWEQEVNHRLVGISLGKFDYWRKLDSILSER
jgi:hypothetical protein